MANAPGWQPDAEHDDQERDWSGSAWTDRVRPEGSAGPADRVPDHLPELHRALSAAAADLDSVDDRISTLFERTEGPRPARMAPSAKAAANDDDIGGAFADLDAALAAEEPDEPAKADWRRMFRRRVKGATAAQS